MPVVEARVVVPVDPQAAFWVSQTTAPIRYRWDPFVRDQRLLDGATRPDKGVRTATVSRHRHPPADRRIRGRLPGRDRVGRGPGGG